MLSSAADGLPGGDGWQFEPKWDGFRTLVFRDGDEILLQSRDEKPMNRYFPELVAPLAARAARALRRRRRDRHRRRRRARLRGAAPAHPSRRVAGEAAGRADRRPRSSPGTCSRSATRTCASVPLAERRERLERVLADAAPPVHLSPATRDRALAEDWFHRFEGAGLDGVMAKRLDEPYRAGERTMIKVKHARTADCVVAGFRWHKNGAGHDGRLAAARPLRRRGHAAPRRRHRGVHATRCASSSSTELAPLRESALEGHPWRDWAEAQDGGERDGAAPARRDAAAGIAART